MAKGDNLRDNLNLFNGLITQLASLDETVKDEDKRLMLLVSVPDTPKYNSLITSLLIEKKILTLDETVIVLLK